jgi:hypothetical protein
MVFEVLCTAMVFTVLPSSQSKLIPILLSRTQLMDRFFREEDAASVAEVCAYLKIVECRD